ncbi:AraC family transcriptional regulator [Paenibacillus sp. 1P07SE]|uniref:helix-turn-helix transcriptional regulator n=1 Tax=Paenibacillus sp. 1P07SE TaxID=3132209 RepID=UPI0039A622C7
MKREFYLANFSEFRFFCFPDSVGNFNRPDKREHDVNRPEGVRDYSLHYIAEGSGTLELDGEVYPLRAGDAFWHVPHEPMRYYSSDDDPWNIYWMQLYGSMLPTFAAENGFHHSSIWITKDGELLRHAFDELLDEIDQHSFLRPSRIAALAYGVFIEFLTNSIPFSHYRSVDNVEKIIALLPQMQKKAHLPFVLDEWAKSAGYTPNYFCTLFKKVTRMTPVAYMTKCRIQLSKHLLVKQPLIPIKEVAITSGYPGLSYFNKKFMEAEGMTPGAFRGRYMNR